MPKFSLLDRPLFNIGGDDEYIHTPFASIPRQSIEPVHKPDTDPFDIHPTSIGSRIGVVYALKQKSIHMHCIFNGFDYGPFSILKIESSTDERSCPQVKRQRTCWMPEQSITEQTKFWAFVDVYGATKRVRIVQLYGGTCFFFLSIIAAISSISSSKFIEKSVSFDDSLSSQII